MKGFFKTFGAALLAFVVGSVVMWLIAMFVFAGFAAGLTAAFSPKGMVSTSGDVLVINFENGIVDSPENRYGSFDMNTMTMDVSNTVLEVANALQVAAVDPKIKGVYINITGNGTMSYGNLEELRNELVKFKNSGKFIVAYDEVYSQPAYWLSSVADKVLIHPEGMLDWKGVSANVMFYKGLLDRLGVEVEVFRHGTFKSAVEPYIMEGMSPSNRIQMETIVNSMWDVMVGDVAASRGISADKLKAYADNLMIGNPEDALECGLVDGVVYEDQAMGMIEALCRGKEIKNSNVSGTGDVSMVSLGDYATAHALGIYNYKAKNKVAIVYADGQIVDGESYNGAVGGATLASQIAQARMDDSIKAVVLRVNSPGGSALASDVIWREMELCREKKPVIVSMGGVAASGGYYISSPADVILADRTTQTGSIGVFGLLLNLEKTFEDKLGITFDVAKTGPVADMGNMTRTMTLKERSFIQQNVEDIYSTFVEHVAAGRNMTFEEVDKIGQGRVWLGVEAEKNGLVDGFGGLADAVSLAVDRSGIASDYGICEILPQQNSFGALMSMLFANVSAASDAGLKDELGDVFVHYSRLKNMIENNGGVMAMMPYTIEFR